VDWGIAVVTVAADMVATTIVHNSDINAADFGAASGATGETTAGTRGSNEGTQVG
jgi:hypothetical protein